MDASSFSNAGCSRATSDLIDAQRNGLVAKGLFQPRSIDQRKALLGRRGTSSAVIEYTAARERGQNRKNKWLAQG